LRQSEEFKSGTEALKERIAAGSASANSSGLFSGNTQEIKEK
jgi:hypothetical protein